MDSILRQQQKQNNNSSENVEKKSALSTSTSSTSTANSCISTTSSSTNHLREMIRNRLSNIDESSLESHLKLGSKIKFRIIILEIAGISSEYSEVFCQFNFMHKLNEAFSTEPIKNSGKGPPLGFFHIQNVNLFFFNI
jgi:hypothetical protein